MGIPACGGGGPAHLIADTTTEAYRCLGNSAGLNFVPLPRPQEPHRTREVLGRVPPCSSDQTLVSVYLASALGCETAEASGTPAVGTPPAVTVSM